MHSAKGGWGGQKGEGSSFASLFYGFCVHGIRTSWRGRGVSWKQSSRHSEVERDLEPSPQPRGGGACSSCQLVWYRILRPSRAVLAQGDRGPPPEALVFSGRKYSSFPEFRTLSSSGNHASLVLNLKLIFLSISRTPPAPRSF